MPHAQVVAGETPFYSSTGPIGPTGPSERGKAPDVGRSGQSVGRFVRAVGRTVHRCGARAPRCVLPSAPGGSIARPNVSLGSPLTWPADDPRGQRPRASWMSSLLTSNRAGRSRTRLTWSASGRAPRSATLPTCVQDRVSPPSSSSTSEQLPGGSWSRASSIERDSDAGPRQANGPDN